MRRVRLPDWAGILLATVLAEAVCIGLGSLFL